MQRRESSSWPRAVARSEMGKVGVQRRDPRALVARRSKLNPWSEVLSNTCYRASCRLEHSTPLPIRHTREKYKAV
eukprot:scaffold2048_cov52-Phaeocystis_antarctica.AAC.3